jgi:hypothetical protein
LIEADPDIKPLIVAAAALAVSGDKLPEGEAVCIELVVNVAVTFNDTERAPDNVGDELPEVVVSLDLDFSDDDDEELSPPDVLEVKETIVE